MKENLLKDKFYKFVLRIMKLYKFLFDKKREYVLSKQCLRSGTSIGANITEGNQAQSTADFIHKLSIAHKKRLKPNIGCVFCETANSLAKNKLNL